ncbi:MAG: RHS repeat-associated core domain-containing protein [Firmicutes bacterium]|nr:RHS repeat-associated core domain-containing protein [Bacillota bacterium]
MIVDASFSFNYDQSPTLVPMIKSNTNFSRHDGRLYELNYTQASGKVTIDVKDYLEQFINQAVISIWDAKTGNSNFTSSVLTVCYVEFYAGEYNITQNLGDGGMGTVNMNNGGFGYAYDSVVTTDYHIPIQISHIFNESYGNSYGVGNGFKLNIQQRVVLEDGLCYYYQSASGKKYYFNNGAIRENKELGLRLYRNSSTGIIQLIDRQGNTLVFNSAGNLIEMHEYPSRYDAPLPAQNIKLTYSGNNISTVTNNFTTLTFGYSGGYLQTITDQSSRKLAQFVYTGDKLTRAEKYFTSSTLSTDAYATLLTYTGNKIASITNELGEKVAYAYTSNQVSSIITSNTKNSNIVPVTTSIEYVTYSRSTLLLCRIVMDRTTVLSQGNYRRHVSFKGNEVVSDYSYEKTANGNFIPMSAYSNKFDYTSFAETYADTRDLYCQEFDTSVVRSHPFNLDITFPTQSGTHSYAMLIWVKRVGNLQNKDLMISENATSLLGFFSRDLLNSNLFDWQFYVYEFNQRTNFSSFTIGIDGDGAAGFSIHSVRLVKLPPQLTKLKKEEFEPVRDSYGRPTAVFQYNAVDNSITSYEYEYGAASGNYPGQLLSITERTGSATLTKAQYEIQATQVSQVVYGYTAYSINNASFSFLTGTTTYGSSSASGAPKFTTSYGYDTVTNSATRGLLTSYTNENGETTTFTYNPNGNVTTTVSDLVYDNSYYDSGLLASTSLGGLSNQLSYNQHGGLASVGHNGFNTSFGYHNDGSLANVSVDNQQLVNYTYSQLQDVVNYSNNQSVLYNYSNDYLQSVVGIKNGTPSTIAEFSYNNRNELAGISHPNTGVDYGYQYTRDFSGTNMDHLLLAYQAANFNALATVHHAIGSDKYITAGYFKHPFAMQTLQMDTATYNYNKFGQLSGINKHNGTLSYAYNDGFNRLTDKTMAFNGGASFTSAYTYPASTITNGRVSTEEFKVGGTTQSAHTYTYYPNGNLQSIIGPNNTTEYFYDQNNQLIRENVNGTQHYYWYNAAGNMVSANAGGFKSFTYQTGWKDQLDTATFGGVTYNITYDTAGNPLQYRHGRTMTWSNGRQLTEIANPTGFFTNIKYDYDYAGMRTSKTVNGIETYYYWEGNKLLAEWKQGVLLWYYYDETGVSGMNYDGQDFYFRKNILGDITEIYNTSGQIVCYYIYDAWGNILVEQHTTYIPGSLAVVQANPWRYRGYYFDRETGFYNLNSRYYDPMLMRFVNADEPTMLFLTASMPSGANLYAYCLNNPVMYTDSTGMFIDQIWNWIQAGYYGLANAAMFMSSVAVALFSGSVTAAAVSAVLAPLGPIGVLAGVGVGALVAVGAFGSALNICWPGTNLGDFGNKINSWAGGHFNTGANFLWHDVAVPGWDWLKKNSDAISEGLFISMFYTWAVPPLFYVNFALFAASSTVSVLKYYGMI